MFGGPGILQIGRSIPGLEAQHFLYASLAHAYLVLPGHVLGIYGFHALGLAVPAFHSNSGLPYTSQVAYGTKRDVVTTGSDYVTPQGRWGAPFEY